MDETIRAAEADIEAVMKILDGFAAGGESRMKLEAVQGVEEGSVSKAYHHGRCDIGSPWARGECFDAAEKDCDR